MSRGDVASFVGTFITVYIAVIFVRIVMSWFPRVPYNRFLSAFLGFVQETTDPYLRIFRRFIPLVRIGPGALDISPIVGVFVLLILRGVIVGLIQG